MEGGGFSPYRSPPKAPPRPTLRARDEHGQIERPPPAPRGIRDERPPHEEAPEPARQTDLGRIERLAILAIAFILFALVGYKLVIGQHLVISEGIDRLTRAYLIWHNDPAKLASIGFDVAPIPTVLMLPFAAVKPLATSLIAMPLFSALFAAGTLVMLTRAFAAAGIAAGLRYLLLVLIALNPLFGFYAINGSPEMSGLFFASFGLLTLAIWSRDHEPRYLVGAAIGFGLASLCDYEFILWSLVLALFVGASLANRDSESDEIEGSVVTYLAPPAFAVVLWTFFSLIILNEPFAWIENAINSAPLAGSVGAVNEASFGRVLELLFEQQLAVALIPLIAFVVLLFTGITQRSPFGIAIALLILTNILFNGLTAFVADDVSVIELRDILPGLIAALAGIAWASGGSGGGAGIAAIIGALVLAVSIPVTWAAMQSYPHQEFEQAFTQALFSGEDQEGVASRGGFRAGIAAELEMAEYINANVTNRNEVLTDNSQTYGVMLLSGRPELFLDRVDVGDREWLDLLADPGEEVEYFLVSDQENDLIGQRYPLLQDNGGDLPGLREEFETEGYRLLSVIGALPDPEEMAQAVAEGDATAAGGDRGGSSSEITIESSLTLGGTASAAIGETAASAAAASGEAGPLDDEPLSGSAGPAAGTTTTPPTGTTAPGGSITTTPPDAEATTTSPGVTTTPETVSPPSTAVPETDASSP